VHTDDAGGIGRACGLEDRGRKGSARTLVGGDHRHLIKGERIEIRQKAHVISGTRSFEKERENHVGGIKRSSGARRKEKKAFEKGGGRRGGIIGISRTVDSGREGRYTLAERRGWGRGDGSTEKSEAGKRAIFSGQVQEGWLRRRVRKVQKRLQESRGNGPLESGEDLSFLKGRLLQLLKGGKNSPGS